MTARRLSLIAAILGAVSFLAWNLGPISPTTSRGLGVLCLALAWISAILAGRLRPRTGLIGATAAIWGGILSLVVILCSADRSIWLGALAFNVCCLPTLLRNSETRVLHSTRALCYACVAYCVAFVVLEHVPVAWNVVQKCSVALSGQMGYLLGTGAIQGASTGGVHIFGLLFLYLLARVLVSRPRHWLLFVFGSTWLVVLLLLQMSYGPIVAVWIGKLTGGALASDLATDAGLALRRSMAAAHSQGLLLVAGILLILLLEKFWPTQTGASTSARVGRSRLAVRAAAFLVACAASALGFHWLLAPRFAQAQEGNVSNRLLIYRTADDSMRSFGVPDFERFGTGSTGMFGLWLRYLTAWGYEPVMMDPDAGIENTVLDSYGVFVIISPDQQLSRAEKQRIWQYVEKGGSLLVMGDHTDIGGTMRPLNDLLSPVGIRFNFDSAFTPTHWANAYETFPHPITVGLDDANQKLSHSTGASLSIESHVCPIVSAKWGFSDAGDRARKDNAFLGDYAYQFTEQLGDVVVIAEAVHGQGKVLVFGDTSAFQNVAIAHSQAFLDKVARHLMVNRPSAPGWKSIAAMALLMTAAAVVWIGAARRRVSPACWAIALPGLVVLLAHVPSRDAIASTMVSGSRVAYVDASHVNRFSLGMWQDDSIDGLLINLARNECLAKILIDEDLGWILDGDVFVVLAPAEPFTPAELDVVQSFMEAGGLLILSVGFEEKQGAAGLLKLVGMDIGDVPLGPVPVEPPAPGRARLKEWMKKPHFKEAWPVLNQWNTPVEPFYQQGVYDVVVFRAIGKGGALVIGDSRYLHDKTLEMERAWWEGNIEFLRSTLAMLSERGVGT